MDQVIIGGDRSGKHIKLPLKLANRHGLITGATGTGKTVTLQVLAEQFSLAGVPVILSDVKGDLSGIAVGGTEKSVITERCEKNNLENFSFRNFPVAFWDAFGEKGIPLHLTVEKFGPHLLSRVLDLNDTQSDIVFIAFKYAKDNKMPLMDLKDFKDLIKYLNDHKKEIQVDYGNISSASVGAIARRLLSLEESGAELFFKEPALNIEHLIQTDMSGQGIINIIDATRLMRDKRIYCCFLLWLLDQLFTTLPEVGDADKPKLVFFFDEAHLLFDDAPKYLVDKVQTVVRLIRSKGVGVYFVSQSPQDIDDETLSQLAHKIQHALRATTEKDRKAVKAIAANYPSDGSFDIEKMITSMGIGESLVSCLDEKGIPQPVTWVCNSPPMSQMGPLEEETRKGRVSKNPFYSIYSTEMNSRSATEILKENREKEKREVETKEKEQKPRRRGSNRQSAFEAFYKSVIRSFGSKFGRVLVNALFKALKK